MALSPIDRPLSEVDPEIARLVREETQRQAEGLELIASENFAPLRPADRIMSLRLAQGGHLTHGSPVNFCGKLFEIHHYGLDPKTETIDFAAARKQAREVKPRVVLCGASAYPRTLDFVRLREISEEVGAMMICDIAHIAGLVAVGLHPSPVPLSDAVTTTTHKTLRGPRSGLILSKQIHAKAVDSNVFPGIQG